MLVNSFHGLGHDYIVINVCGANHAYGTPHVKPSEPDAEVPQ